MVFDTLLFIKRIQAYPEIFDTATPGFKQVDDKNGAWEKIAAEFKVDGRLRVSQPLFIA
jgi:Alcohol dehydrogenase transcription factor Myb/SANT-like